MNRGQYDVEGWSVSATDSGDVDSVSIARPVAFGVGPPIAMLFGSASMAVT